MLPVEKKNEQVSLFEFSQDPRIRRRQTILSIPEVVGKLNDKDTMVVNASVKMPIKQYPDNKLVEKVIIIGKGILRDLGVKNWHNSEANEYILTRFADVLSRYYKELTLSDVKLAFEFLMVGELDDFLPKDRHGKPERRHFQDFSFEYYSNVLNAYKEKLSSVWQKASELVPKIEYSISEQEKKNNHNSIITEIYEAFEKYKSAKIEPSFDIEIYINVLVDNDLIEIKEPKDSSFKKAYNQLLVSQYITKLERSEMIDKFQRNVKTHTLKMEAKRIENNKTMKAYFDNLIKSEKHINEVLKLKP